MQKKAPSALILAWACLAPCAPAAVTDAIPMEPGWEVEVFAPGVTRTDMLAFAASPGVLFANRELSSGGVTRIEISPLSIDNTWVTGINRADGITFSDLPIFGPDGKLFVTAENTDSQGNQVLMIDPITAVTTVIASGNVVSNPEGLAFDPLSADPANPTLYVAEDRNPGDIWAIDNVGTTNDRAIFVSGLERPEGVAFDPTNGDLYICETNTDRILRFNPPDNTLNVHVEASAGIIEPDNITHDPGTGTFLIAEDQSPGRILRVTTDTPPVVTEFATDMAAPQGMVFQPGTDHRVLFVSEQFSDQILRFTLPPVPVGVTLLGAEALSSGF